MTVDFPAPDFPTSAVVLPFGMLKLTSVRAFLFSPPYEKVAVLNSYSVLKSRVGDNTVF